MKKLLGFIMAWFIGILIVVYFISKQADPVFVDVHGNPTNVAKKGS